MASNLDLSGCKKRRRGERIFKFKTFFEQGHPVGEVECSFRNNVKGLLEFGHLERNLSCRLPSWSFQLEACRNPPVHVHLFVVEEPVEVSLNRHCKHCQYIGWGHHMICNKKYHFLLSTKERMVNSYLGLDGSYDNGPSPEKGKPNTLEPSGHLMHGVFHSNGFGHLLCVNGVEKGSELAGHEIMDFWERLCIGLRARKVSILDISQKRGMELRLLHGVAYSEPWFGRWGYKFGVGSFGVTQPMYHKALKAIKDTPLCLLINQLAPFNPEISIIISRYQILSDYTLVTLGDLFHFVLELESRLPCHSTYNTDFYNPGILLETTCRWSPKRVEMATRVIVEALRRAEFRWISRQEVRDMARAYIGDTGLLDFVLKSLGNQVVGNYLVRRSLNPVTKVLEYCLEDLSNPCLDQQGTLMARYKITRGQVMKDTFYLYKHIFKEQTPMINNVPARIILDTKYLIKGYIDDNTPPNHEILDRSKGEMKLHCSVVLKNNCEDYINDLINKAMPVPHECVSLKHNATVDELKLEVQETFREIYWGLRNNFVIESLVNVNAQGTDLAIKLVEDESKLVFEGSGNEGMFESSNVSRVVECECGARDDDGERMVSCDICDVWQHTRCVRIPNNLEVPTIFICDRCEHDIIPLHSLPIL